MSRGDPLGAPPAARPEALPFFGQWLAERNLGLVPVAEAAAFRWPGRWLARVRTADGDHAVVMFGSPPGPVCGRTSSSGGAIAVGDEVAAAD